MVARGADTNLVKRGGIISSKVGLGFDYYLGKPIQLSVDFIDTTDSEVRLKGSYLMTDNIRFELRIDDAADRRDVHFGIEYKF